MSVITLQEAQAGLAEIIHKLTPGEEVVITENNQPVATTPKPAPGLGKGWITIVADDDEHLDDFKEYMP